MDISPSVKSKLDDLRILYPGESYQSLFARAVDYMFMDPIEALDLHREKIEEQVLHLRHYEGMSLRSIVRTLNKANVRTFSGRGLWAHGVVQRIIKKYS